MKEMKTEKQAAIYSVGSVVLMFAQWLISVLLVRLGSFEDAGVFSLAMSIANVFVTFANYNTRSYQVSDLTGQFTQAQYLYMRTLLIFVTLAACAVYVTVGGYTALERAAIMIYLVYMCSLFWGDIMMGSLQLKGRLYINGYACCWKGAGCFIAFMLSYVLWHRMLLSLLLMALTMIAITLAYDLPQYLTVEKLRPPRAADAAAIARLCRICFPLMLTLLFPIVVNAYPRRIISLQLGNTQLGYFASLFTPTAIITTMLPTFMIGLIPQVADTWQRRDKSGFLKVVAKCYALVIAFSVLAELCVIVAGKAVIRLVFGEELMPYFGILHVAILASGIDTATICGNSVLTGIRQSTSLMIMAGIELLVTVVLSQTMVSRYGILGAALVMCVSYGVHAVLQLALLGYQTAKHF